MESIVSESEELQLLEELEKSFSGLRTKDDVLLVLENTSLLHRIPLGQANVDSVSTEQAKKDFCRERVLLNDVPFIPDTDDASRSQAFMSTLQVLVRRMKIVVNDDQSYSAEKICELIMQRACRFH